MRKLLTLAALLCTFALALPLTSNAVSSSECITCPAGSCSSNADCTDGPCIKRPGACCGACA